MGILKNKEPYQEYSIPIILWHIFLTLNLILSVVIILDFFLDEYYVEATVSHIQKKSMVANFETGEWTTVKYNPKLSNTFFFGDTILLKATPIFDFCKSYCRKAEKNNCCSNIGINVLFPLFTIMLNIIVFSIFIFVPNIFYYRTKEWGSFYYSIVSYRSIARSGVYLFVLPTLINLFYWYKLFCYLFC